MASDEMDVYTRAALEYILPEFVDEAMRDIGRFVSSERSIIQAFFYELKDMRMYGNDEELRRELTVYLGFPGYDQLFYYLLGELPVDFACESYTSLKGKQYLYTKDIYHHMQRVFYMYDETDHSCMNSKFVTYTMFLALRMIQARTANKLELVECSPRDVEKFLIEEVLQKEESVLQRLHGLSLNLLTTFRSAFDFSKNDAVVLMKFFMSELDEMEKNNTSGTGNLFETCIRWLKNLNKAVKNKHEWLNAVPAVRLFNDNGRKFVMITEWIEQMEKTGADLKIMDMPEHFFSANEVATIDLKDIARLAGTENMSKIEFVVTPVRRAKHAAVRIPTRDGRFCIPGSDALIQLLKDLIHGKKLFQRTDRESWARVESFLNKVTAFFNGENVSYFFIDCDALKKIRDECDKEFLELGLPNTTTYILDVKRGELDVEKIKEELKNLNLIRVFPEILDYAELAFEKIMLSRFKHSLQTSDMYDAVEYCQMACIFENFPKLKQFLHSQKSCHRIIKLDCSECNVPCSMKVTKWEQYVVTHEIQEIGNEDEQGGSNLSVYPLCKGGNYAVYPCSSLLKDTYYLRHISEAALAKHEELVLAASSEIIPFILVDTTDREWYYKVLLKELVDNKETITYHHCVNRMMERKREKFYLRTMWRWDSRNKECVGVLKEDVFHILPFVLKQQSLCTNKNIKKLEELYSSTENRDSRMTTLEVFSLCELKEVLEMFNINKEIFVLVPDYHLCYNLLSTSRSETIEYDTTFGKAYTMHDAAWCFFQSIGTMCDWTDIWGKKSKKFESLRAVHDRAFRFMICWFCQKDTYITVKAVKNMMKQISDACKELNIDTFDHMKIKEGMPEDLIKFQTFLDHPMVKLGKAFSDKDKSKLRNMEVHRGRMYAAIMLLAVERLPKNDYPQLKEHFMLCLEEYVGILPTTISLEDVIVSGEVGSLNNSAKMKEEFKRRKKEKLEATVENVFAVVFYDFETEKGMENPVEEKNKLPKQKHPITHQTSKTSTDGPSEYVKIEEQNMNESNQNSLHVSNETKRIEPIENYFASTPMVNAATSLQPKNDSEPKNNQKAVDNKSHDGARKKEDTVEKCIKCHQTRLECTKEKEALNMEKKKTNSLEKKLEAKDKELNVLKQREASIEETVKKKYQDELNEVNRKLKELTDKYTGEKSADSAKIHELKQRLEWRTVEVDRKVDHVMRNKQRELEEKDAIANSLQDTIKTLNEQATSRDILTRALQENIRELTQQLKSKDLILQTIPDQNPSSSSSHQNHDQPSTSSSTPFTGSTSQERTPKEVIEDVLQRLKADRENVRRENSLKQERATKLLKNFPGKEMRNWINYELRKFNVDYGVYLKALEEHISVVEKVNEIPRLPPAPGFSEKFLNMYNEIVKKESELKAKNYTRMKTATCSRAPEELEDQECLICLADMNDRDITLKCSSCSRRYHEKCLGDWLHKKRLCPTCGGGMLHEDEFPMP